MYPKIKRLVDILFAFVVFFTIAPFLLLLIWLQLVIQGAPIFFFQPRMGFRVQPFLIFKFRTMCASKLSDSNSCENDKERLTKWGLFMRRTSLDELPQLVNVLLGEMSIIGPRPLPINYYDRMSIRHQKRYQVLPGITGWAQVSGRNQLNWKDKFDCDVYYLNNLSLRLDLMILAKTPITVLHQTGISQTNHATMQEFLGALEDPSYDA